MKRLLAFYQNGNYTVRLYSDGTKVKMSAEGTFCADFPDSIDLKVTDYCDRECPMCHERSSVRGAAGDLCAAFLDTLHAGTELAIGGGDPLSHPDLLPFLSRMRRQGIVCNLTVNGVHLLRERERVEELLDRGLVHGLGVSLTDVDGEVLSFASRHPNTVLHLICGVFTDFQSLFDRDLKLLLLGYKRFGRGASYYDARVEQGIAEVKKMLPAMLDRFAVVSFDNLALAQLDVRSLLSEEEYERTFMGEDGEGSMYIDLVRGEFAKSSTATDRFSLHGDIASMHRALQRRG